MNRENTDLLVTIQCLTYNHEPYIRKCLEGFIMQKTNFRFEAIVHDDASTDGTAEIVREYSEKYPGIIRAFFETENQYSKHNGVIGKIIRENTHGKYIAMCEGDDFWIDPLKLQKQVDLLENNPSVSLCCGGYITRQNGHLDKEYICHKGTTDYFQFSLNDWENFWYTKTLTVLYRREAFSNFLLNLDKYHYSRDTHLYYNLLKWGDGIYLSECLGVYNLHVGGIWSLVSERKKAMDSYNCYKELYKIHRDDFLRKKYVAIICRRMIYEDKKNDLFKEGWKYAILVREKCKLLTCLLPSSVLHLALRLKRYIKV